MERRVTKTKGTAVTTRSSIPVDDLLVDEVQPTDEEYRAGLTAHQRAKEKVLQGPKARARYEAALAEARAHQAGLARLRKARALAQATVAELMGMNQSEVSKLERRSDMLMSTMRRFVEATGGTLRLVAVYPEGSVELRVGAEIPPVEQEPISTRERSGAKATVRVVRAQKTIAAKGAAPVRGTHSKAAPASTSTGGRSYPGPSNAPTPGRKSATGSARGTRQSSTPRRGVEKV